MPYQGFRANTRFNPTESQTQRNAVRSRNASFGGASRIRYNTGSGRVSKQFLQLSPEYFQQLRQYAMDFKRDRQRVHWAIDRSVMGYAMATLGFAQKRSRGFLDPQQKSPDQAWKIPVRRITGNYLEGWRVRQVRLGVWDTLNDSREAYFIEFGINHSGTGLKSPGGGDNVRIRRPILKLAVMDAVAFARATHMPIRQFMGAFTFSSHSSPLTNMSEGAIKQTLNAGESFVYGAINAG